jgi:hypothetical protein
MSREGTTNTAYRKDPDPDHTTAKMSWHARTHCCDGLFGSHLGHAQQRACFA